MKKACDYCGRTFETKLNRQVNCSDKCRALKKSRKYWKAHGDQHRAIHNHTCKQCGKEFSSKKRKTQYCSLKCCGLARRKYLDIPECLSSASRKIDKNIGYVRVYCPMHPEANTWGYVYEHRLIAEQKIGRRLLKHEVVHHKNGKRWDNAPDNLQVMSKYEHGKLNKITH